jgi:hypothetical protein
MIEFSKNIPFIKKLFRKKYMIEMSYQYESAFKLKQFLLFILNNSNVFSIGEVPIQRLNQELKANIYKLEELIQKIFCKDSAIIQLYQTKRAATEILHFKKKYLKRLMNKGCLTQNEMDDMMNIVEKCARKCEIFGFTLGNNYFKGRFN